jgi:pimeloyl-ACP methyl ester carboxylesterase
MLHGWLDNAATFQFVVDAFENDWHVIAPDLRGHGGSHFGHEPYFFMQHIADLDSLLEHYSPSQPVRLIGHSLGANVSSIYAGSRPERVNCFVNIEGMAPAPRYMDSGPDKVIGQWLTRLRAGPKNRVYADRAELAARLCQANPRLTSVRAGFLAEEFSRMRADGRVEFAIDPHQYVPSPTFGHRLVVEACWSRIEAPVLLITGSESYMLNQFDDDPEIFRQRVALLQRGEHVNIGGAGHNLHHEVPEQVAALAEEFMLRWTV